jgi:hypothetical protein
VSHLPPLAGPEGRPQCRPSPSYRLHIDRASFDFAQDEDDCAWHLPMEIRKNLILSEVEGRTASIQVLLTP